MDTWFPASPAPSVDQARWISRSADPSHMPRNGLGRTVLALGTWCTLAIAGRLLTSQDKERRRIAR
jgi:hypothetical protein